MRQLIKFYRENGVFVTIAACCARLHLVCLSRLLSRRLRASGLLIGPGSYLRGLAHVRVGRNFHAGRHFRLEAIADHNGLIFSPQIIIKDDVSVSDFVHIGATNRIEIGKGVLMGSRVFISDHNHGYYTGNDQSRPETPPHKRPVSLGAPITIHDNVWIGEQVCILPGVTIGAGTIIGAGSVVTKDVPPACIAAGSPARVLKRFDPATSKWLSLSNTWPI